MISHMALWSSGEISKHSTALLVLVFSEGNDKVRVYPNRYRSSYQEPSLILFLVYP